MSKWVIYGVSEATIEKYRHINVDHDSWWDSTYEGFKEQMSGIGIDVDRMYFSGFWSQGGGACFEGCVHDWELFLKSLGYDNPVLIQHALDNWYLSVEHSGRYYHEDCTRFNIKMPIPMEEGDKWFMLRYSPYPWDKERLRSQAWLAVLQGEDYDALKGALIDAFKDHMRELYKDLEKEYDYLTSNEAVIETIIANDLNDDIDEGE